MAETKNPGRGGARAGASMDLVVADDTLEDTPSATSRQAARLKSRFALPPSVARAVAGLAYGEACA